MNVSHRLGPHSKQAPCGPSVADEMRRPGDENRHFSPTVAAVLKSWFMRQARSVGFTLVELMIVVAIVGILAAIAIPNFIKYQAKSKQAEAKQSLKAYFMSQRDYFGENDAYSDDLGALGFAPERGNRYAYKIAITPAVWLSRSTIVSTALSIYDGIEVDCYKFGGTCIAQPTRPTGVATHIIAYDPGTSGPASTGFVAGSGGAFTMEAVATIDNDQENDVWLVSSGTVQVTGGMCAEGVNGVPGVSVAIYDDSVCP